MNNEVGRVEEFNVYFKSGKKKKEKEI